MLKKPQSLKPGDNVGLVSVSSPVSKEIIKRSCEYLRSLGFSVITSKHILDRKGYMAGSAQDRADDLNFMFSSSNIRAVFCAYGGTSANQLLPLLDYKMISTKPKVFVGLSDSSILSLAINSQANIVAFHGPTGYNFGEAGMTAYTESYFLKALCDPRPIGEIAPIADWTPIIDGTAEGPIIGANLTLLQTLMGTQWEPDWAGKILFWEDICIERHTIDLILTHLVLAGVMNKIKGMVIGRLVECEEKEYELAESFDDMVRRIMAPYNIPVLANVDLGHTDDKITIPIGTLVRIEANDVACRLCFTESATEQRP